MAKKRLIVNGQPFEYDMNDPEDASLYEQNKQVKGALDPDEIAKNPSSEDGGFFSKEGQIKRLGSAAMMGFPAGLMGGPAAGVAAGLGAYAFPPEDMVDVGIGLAGGPLAGKVSSLTRGALKNSGKAANVFGQIMTGAGYGTAENAISKAIKNPKQTMEKPSSLLPTSPQELLSVALQGGLAGMGANMEKTPSAISARKFPGTETNPSKLSEAIEKNKDKLKPIDQEIDDEAIFIKDLDDKIQDYKTRRYDTKERKLELEAKRENIQASQEYKKAKQSTVVAKEQQDIIAQRENVKESLFELSNQESRLKDGYTRGIVTSEDFAQQSKQLFDQRKALRTQLKDLAVQREGITVQKMANNEIPLDIQRANTAIRNNIIRLRREDLKLGKAIDDTKREIDLGSMKDAELGSIFKNSKSKEELIDKVMGSSPAAMKKFFSYYDQKGLGTDMREAFLQRIAMESFDPQTNSFGNGVSYITDKIKGNATEKLGNIFGDIKKADKFIQDFKEINEAMSKIKSNQLKSSFFANLGLAAAFTIGGRPAAGKILATEGGTLLWMKWGTLLNKMASSPKFNSLFKDWMKDGASAEFLKKSDYLLSQLREMGYSQDMTE